MKEYENRGFVIKQRAFIKVYLIHLIERQKNYGWNYFEEIRTAFKPFGYKPTTTEIYRCLHELVDENILYRVKQNKQGAEYQEVVLYKFCEDGWEKAKLYKLHVKADLDRSISILKQTVKEIY